MFYFNGGNKEDQEKIIKKVVRRLQYLKDSIGLKFNMYGKKTHGIHRILCNFTCPSCKKEFKRKSIFGLFKRNGLCVSCFTKTISNDTEKKYSADEQLNKNCKCSREKCNDHTGDINKEEKSNVKQIKLIIIEVPVIQNIPVTHTIFKEKKGLFTWFKNLFKPRK